MDLTAVRAELEQVVRESDAAIVAFAREDEDVDMEEADVSSEITEADREEALAEAAEARREEALAALARLDAGTFGICVDCGTPIVEERLLFRPEAARCLEDQQRLEEREG
ncbi:MAG TPA: TraR/DksA C4-type zinc finger protein [Mycobacteriales bacterium]|nr:TraR/DksA C4-type zinc finger protein [Mycobacteriales bacterium]